MTLEALVSKYIASADKVLSNMEQAKGSVTVNEIDISKTIDYARAYLKDAMYYKAHKKFETSLTSVAYCEGLLDALRLLGLVKFEWPVKQENEK